MFNTIFTFSAVSFHELEREREWKSKLCCWKKKSKPTSNSFLKKSVLVVIKHVYNRQLILSTGEILFIHLQHNITRKIMLVINPHVLNAVEDFKNAMYIFYHVTVTPHLPPVLQTHSPLRYLPFDAHIKPFHLWYFSPECGPCCDAWLTVVEH